MQMLIKNSFLINEKYDILLNTRINFKRLNSGMLTLSHQHITAQFLKWLTLIFANINKAFPRDLPQFDRSFTENRRGHYFRFCVGFFFGILPLISSPSGYCNRPFQLRGISKGLSDNWYVSLDKSVFHSLNFHSSLGNKMP
jgi:hypothetical protein